MGSEPRLGIGDEMSLRSDMVLIVMGLYSVVVGLALAHALDSLAHSPSIQSDVLVVTFLLLVLPFYQGALVSTMITYVNRGFQFDSNSVFVRARQMYDMMMLFAESLLFYAMSLFTNQPTSFVWTLTGLMVVDLVWAVNVLKSTLFGKRSGNHYEALDWHETITELTNTLRRENSTKLKLSDELANPVKASKRRQTALWVWLDGLTLLVLFALYLFGHYGEHAIRPEISLVLAVILAVIGARTFVDYWRGFDFYFPKQILEDLTSASRGAHP